MVVGVCRVGLFLPENTSLKGKRSVVRSLLAKARNRFNLAAAEVGALDSHHRAELGFCVVSNDGRHASSMLEKIALFCEQNALAEVSDISTELIPMGKAVGTPMADPSTFPCPEAWKRD